MVAHSLLASANELYENRSIFNFPKGTGSGCSLIYLLLILPSLVSGAPNAKLDQPVDDNGADARNVQLDSMQSLVDRGRYLIRVGGCNDCHTQGFSESGGHTPEQDWLMGTMVGYSGPWGTTYPANLRLYFDSLTETEWRLRAHSPMRPPMPTPSLMAMTDEDLDAIYTYVRYLGPTGTPAPAYVPPGETIHTPFLDFVPHAQ